MNKCITLPSFFNKSADKVEQVSIAGYSFKIFKTIDQIPHLIVTELQNNNSFFFSYEYWKSYEIACKHNINFRYIIISYMGEPVALAPIQIIKFNGSNVAKAYSDNSIFKKLKTYVIKTAVKLFSIRLLVSGNTVLTGEYAIYLKPGFKLNESLAYTYYQSIETLMQQENLKGVLVKDFYAETTQYFNILEQNGFLKFEVNPNMEMNIMPYWYSMIDYEKDLSSKYRVRYHKAIQRGKNLVFRQLTQHDIDTCEQALNNMLLEVLNKSQFKLFYPDFNYLKTLQNKFPDSFKIFGIFLNENLIAFYSTYCCNKQMIACFVGMNKSYLKSHDLYLNILYQLIAIAINHKAEKLVLGRTAMEIKSAVGAQPKNMFLYVKHACPVRNFLVHIAVKTLSNNPEWTLREPFKKTLKN